MKKFLSLTLISVLLATTLIGCGKKKEVEEQPEVVLEPLKEVVTPATEVVPESEPNSVGLMAFYPNNNENMYALAGTNTFTVYFQNKRVKVGTGKLGIYDAESNAIYASVNAEDTNCFEIGTMDSIGTSLTGWEDGTKIDIYMSKVFLPGGSYYVLIDEGFFTLGSISSGAVTNASLITFNAKPYGVDLTGTYMNKVYDVGDETSFQVLVDGQEATMYAVKEYDQSFIEATPINGSEDTTLRLKFLRPGTPSIKVAFFKSGKIVDSITFTFDVEGEDIYDNATSEASEDIDL